MHVRVSIIALVAQLLMLGCAAAASDASDRAALESAAQTWTNAYNLRDVEAMLALVTDDIVLLDPSLAPISGRQAAREALDRALARAQSRLVNVTKEIVISGELAWRIGALSREHAGANASTGQSLEIWQRSKGQWKLRRLMTSGVLAPSALVRPAPSEPRLDTPRS